MVQSAVAWSAHLMNPERRETSGRSRRRTQSHVGWTARLSGQCSVPRGGFHHKTASALLTEGTRIRLNRHGRDERGP